MTSGSGWRSTPREPGDRRPPAIEQIADTGSFCSWDSAPLRTGVSEEYRATLARAAHRGDTDESILTGKVTIGGHAAALVVSEFRFLGGSVGRDAADRLVAAVRRATTERLPLIASPASGGTRMQEGTPAFVTMVDITRAVEAHKAAGLPYLVVVGVLYRVIEVAYMYNFLYILWVREKKNKKRERSRKKKKKKKKETNTQAGEARSTSNLSRQQQHSGISPSGISLDASTRATLDRISTLNAIEQLELELQQQASPELAVAQTVELGSGRGGGKS